MSISSTLKKMKQEKEAYEKWDNAREAGANAYDTMSPLVAHYLLTSQSRSICIAWGDLREHPVFALLCIEDPSLMEL